MASMAILNGPSGCFPPDPYCRRGSQFLVFLLGGGVDGCIYRTSNKYHTTFETGVFSCIGGISPSLKPHQASRFRLTLGRGAFLDMLTRTCRSRIVFGHCAAVKGRFSNLAPERAGGHAVSQELPFSFLVFFLPLFSFIFFPDQTSTVVSATQALTRGAAFALVVCSGRRAGTSRREGRQHE